MNNTTSAQGILPNVIHFRIKTIPFITFIRFKSLQTWIARRIAKKTLNEFNDVYGSALVLVKTKATDCYGKPQFILEVFDTVHLKTISQTTYRTEHQRDTFGAFPESMYSV